ncbi:MAG: sporulation protein [Actinocatenispora sp.]
MIFKSMMQALGVGGPSVETVLSNPNVRPGQMLSGQVHVAGGDHDVEINYVALGLATRMEVESGDNEYSQHVEFSRVAATSHFVLAAGARTSFPFQLQIPWETPITVARGHELPGMHVGLHTELEVARAVDKSDLDPIAVHPLPVQEGILAGFEAIGFHLMRADLERGHIHGVHQELPFYQEIEYHASGPYAHSIKDAEVTFLAKPHGMDVVLEFGKRGGLLTAGHDTYSRFTVDYQLGERTDWAPIVDGWVREAAQRRGLF